MFWALVNFELLTLKKSIKSITGYVISQLIIQSV